jgi:hypothetical protein
MVRLAQVEQAKFAPFFKAELNVIENSKRVKKKDLQASNPRSNHLVFQMYL